MQQRSLKSIKIRFYEELNDFLPYEKRKVQFEHNFIDRTSVKDLIESLGVPHTEIDLILINGKSVDFSYTINDKDEISVYPVFESFDISEVQRLRLKPLRIAKFVLDVHLGKLARYMRLLGFDTVYKNDFNDDKLVKVSLNEKRTVLTKDREILKRNDVTHGYWVRNENSEEQIKEVITRFDLKNKIKEFTRCLECNSILFEVKKENVFEQVPPKVKEWHSMFYQCSGCKKIYWQGSHYDKMLNFIADIKKNF